MTARRGSGAVRGAFAQAAGQGRAALIPYITAGFPTATASAAVLDAIAEAGADLIELGVPFSDPIADGPTIQHASQIALEAGFTLGQALEQVSSFRGRHATPLILFTYLNPVLAFGLDDFVTGCREAGVDGVLLVDLSFEEGGHIRRVLAKADLALVPLLAPSTASARERAIANAGSGFLYYVSMAGVTGQSIQGIEAIADRLATIKTHSQLPVAVGFGIRTRDHVASLAPIADGVVVGSQLVRTIDAAGPDRAAQAAAALVGDLRAGTAR